MKCINIYTVISQHLDNRTKYINSTLTKIKEISDDLKINIGFFSVSQPNPEYIQENIEKYNNRVDYTKKEDDVDYNITPLNIQTISNIEKHRHILKTIASGDNEINLVLEDDALINIDYVDNIKELLIKLSKNEFTEWDMILTCISFNDREKEIYIDNIVNHTKNILNKSSYLIKPKMAQQLYDYFETFKYNFKTSVSKFMSTHECKVCILNKHTFLEGSKLGIFPSSVNTENILYQSKEYMEIQKIIKSIENMDDKEKDNATQTAERIYDNVKDFKGPDITYTMGLLYYKLNDYKKAQMYMKDACLKLKTEKGLISKSSSILNNAINIYQYNQYMLEEYKKRKSKYD